MTKTTAQRIIRRTRAAWAEVSHLATEDFQITLPGGDVELANMPLGQAVALEEKGITIVALGPSPSDWEV
jgi:hypothetical protein